MDDIKERNKVIQIIMQNMGIIHKVANMFCKSPEDKDDLIQEIMTQLWSSFEKYDDAYKLGTWMYRVSLNIAISFYRKNQTQEKYFMPLDEKLDVISNDENEVETNNLELLEKFISELKEFDKALMLLYLEKKSHQEISEILGITTSNVSTKIARIKEGLKQQFSNLNNQ
ncbi:MAG: sigma-70 family RNA polymerase sigma factor [Bacteroidota bacterium]